MYNPEVKAQQSIHFVLGNDYSFDLMGTDLLHLNTEALLQKVTNRC